MSHSDICKHCLESWSEHEALNDYCPKYDDSNSLYFDKTQKFERLNIREVMSELSRLRDREQQLVEALREVIKTLDFEEEVHWLYKEIESLLNKQPDENT